MDNQNYSFYSNLYNIYYYDDNKNKHLVFNTSQEDIKFINERFGKENCGFLKEDNKWF